MAKKDNDIWMFVGIAILIIVIIWGYQNGKFSNNYFSTTENDYITQDTNNPSNTGISYQISVWLTPNTICTGGTTVGNIDTNMPNGICRLYIKTSLTNWQLLDIVTLNSNGKYSQSRQVDIPGTAYVYANCCDSNNNCKNSNTATLIVNICNSENPEPSCIDSDNGKISTILGNCQDSYHQLGYQDSCSSSSSVLEYFCGSDLTCHSEIASCPVGWVCINGACMQPPCQSGIINPTSQGSCNPGYCGIGEGYCEYVPASLVEPARCGCSLV